MTEINIPNRTIFCKDNLDVMQGINSNCIDLIYLDPPFNKNKKFTAPIGSSAEGAEFSDIFREEDIKGEWLVTIREDQPELYHYLNGIKGVGNPYNFAYLAYMAIRLIECHRILKETGSIYLHCDPTMSHYLKSLLDCVFGENNFRNEIVWCYTGPGSPKMRQFNRKHDIIFWYSRGINWTFDADAIRLPYAANTISRGKYDTGSASSVAGAGFRDTSKGKIPETWWTGFGAGGQMAKNERTGYPTQKPLALIERIIRASSKVNDVVLDPFCGCATTCVAAERLERQWMGVDISIKAYELVNKRLTKEAADPNDLLKYQNTIHLKTDPPKRTDLGNDYREKKFVYVISHPEYPREYKVGIAKNWKSRLNAYQTSDPDRRFKVEFTHLTPLFRETEKHIHNLFPNKHEWVQGDLVKIIQSIKSYKPEHD